MTNKLFRVGIVTAVMIVLFVLFPDVLVPSLEDVPEPPEAMAEFIRFQLPPGFTANVFATDLSNVRDLERDPNGTIIASLTKDGTIVTVTDVDRDGVADETLILAEGLNNPHGISLVCDDTDRAAVCSLYVAETDKVSEYHYDPTTREAVFVRKIASLPSIGDHQIRGLLYDPDKHSLFVAIGSSCEFCQELDSRYASIQRFDLETGKLSTYATGLYNTVFLAIQPGTKKIWGTEMAHGGSVSDPFPPDEINIIEEGKDYGWPYCYGNNLPIEGFDFDDGVVGGFCTTPSRLPSVIDLPAHSVPLGLTFIPSQGWPAEYAGDLLVIYRGLSATELKGGYRIVRIEMDAIGKPTGSVKPFVVGFDDASGEPLDRPVDLHAETDGTLFISSDLFGRIYRVSLKTGP